MSDSSERTVIRKMLRIKYILLGALVLAFVSVYDFISAVRINNRSANVVDIEPQV